MLVHTINTSRRESGVHYVERVSALSSQRSKEMAAACTRAHILNGSIIYIFFSLQRNSSSIQHRHGAGQREPKGVQICRTHVREGGEEAWLPVKRWSADNGSVQHTWYFLTKLYSRGKERKGGCHNKRSSL
jgi:hypothetical protein